MCNRFIQKVYYLEVNSLDIHSCICPFCKNKSLIFYGFYKRRIRIPDSSDFEMIEIRRVKCKHCNKTHALLPNTILVRCPFIIQDVITIFQTDPLDSDSDSIIHTSPITSDWIHSLKAHILNWKNVHSFDIFSSINDLIHLFFNFNLYQHSQDCFAFLIM